MGLLVERASLMEGAGGRDGFNASRANNDQLLDAALDKQRNTTEQLKVRRGIVAHLAATHYSFLVLRTCLPGPFCWLLPPAGRAGDRRHDARNGALHGGAAGGGPREAEAHR